MCDSGVEDKKVRAYKVTRADCGSANCIYRDGATLIDGEFDGAEVGDAIEVTLVEMTERELDNLPDFQGW